MSRNEDEEFDENALAALLRPSTVPQPSKASDSSSGEDDGKLDLRALASSFPPPAPEPPNSISIPSASPQVQEPAVAARTVESIEAPRDAKSATRVVEDVATDRASAPRRNVGMFLGLGLGAVACAAVYFVAAQPAEEPRATVTEVGTAPRQALSEPVPAPATAAPAALPSEVEATPSVTPPPPSAPEAPRDRVAANEPAAPAPSAPAASAPRTSDDSSRTSEFRGTRRERPSAEAAEEAPPSEPVAEAPARSRTTEAPAVEPAAPTPPPVEAPPEAPTRTAGALDSVLDQALGGRPDRSGTRTTSTASASAPAASRDDLPETPDSVEVRRVLSGLMPSIRECAGDQVGMALATLMVRSDGQIGSVMVGGAPFAGTPQGACMEGALRQARFSPFKQSQFRVQYPMSIRPLQ